MKRLMQYRAAGKIVVAKMEYRQKRRKSVCRDKIYIAYIRRGAMSEQKHINF